jgi:hypothetical protein
LVIQPLPGTRRPLCSLPKRRKMGQAGEALNRSGISLGRSAQPLLWENRGPGGRPGGPTRSQATFTLDDQVGPLGHQSGPQPAYPPRKMTLAPGCLPGVENRVGPPGRPPGPRLDYLRYLVCAEALRGRGIVKGRRPLGDFSGRKRRPGRGPGGPNPLR